MHDRLNYALSKLSSTTGNVRNRFASKLTDRHGRIIASLGAVRHVSGYALCAPLLPPDIVDFFLLFLGH